jgi:hypothetical protein
MQARAPSLVRQCSSPRQFAKAVPPPHERDARAHIRHYCCLLMVPLSSTLESFCTT